MLDRDDVRERLLTSMLSIAEDTEVPVTARVSSARLVADMLGLVTQRQKDVPLDDPGGGFDDSEDDQGNERSLAEIRRELDSLKAELGDDKQHLDAADVARQFSAPKPKAKARRKAGNG